MHTLWKVLKKTMQKGIAKIRKEDPKQLYYLHFNLNCFATEFATGLLPR